MTTPARRKQIAEASARLRAKRKEAGLVRSDVWAHPDDWAEIRALEKRLAEQRKGGYVASVPE